MATLVKMALRFVRGRGMWVVHSFEHTLVFALQLGEKSQIPKYRVVEKCRAAFCLLCHLLTGNLHSPADFQLISGRV